MKAVLDEGVPRDLVKLLRAQGCDVSPFPNVWKGTKNGRLIDLVAESGFDVLLTCDRSIRFQQNLHASDVAIVILPAQKLDMLRTEIPSIERVLALVGRGTVTVMRREAGTK